MQLVSKHLGVLLLLCVPCSLARAEARPTPEWLAFQLVPSVELWTGDASALALTWQLTPLAFSWAVHEGLSPLRVFVVEPNVRHGGSVELYAAAGVILGEGANATARVGARSYVPLLSRGEVLSLSFGAAYRRSEGDALILEAGIYAVYGIVGLQVSVALPDEPRWLSITLSLRYF